jgi:hypothetical protein
MDALRRSSRISRKERVKKVTIRQQIGLEETIVKENEQNQLTWYGHIQRMVEGRLPKLALKWVPKQKRARGRPKKKWMEGIRKAMNERNLSVYSVYRHKLNGVEFPWRQSLHSNSAVELRPSGLEHS